MFTLYRIAFHVVSLSCTVQCEQIFFAVMVRTVLKIFSVKHVLDKSKKGLWHRCFPVNFVKFFRTSLVAASGCKYFILNES